MKVRFLQDYQGQHTGPHFYLMGQTAEVADSAAVRLVADGRAEMVHDETALPVMEYEEMSMVELRQVASEVGADLARSKAELIGNIRAVEAQCTAQ